MINGFCIDLKATLNYLNSGKLESLKGSIFSWKLSTDQI